MISKKLSVSISNVLVKLMFVALVMAVFFVPVILKHYIEVFNKSQNDYVLLLAVTYVSMLPALAALICLDRLIKNIYREEIFVSQNVKMLRILSWCCFFVAIIYGAFGFAYTFALLISFAAVFFGLVLRVLKNVFAEAVSIKEENDFTV